MNYEEVENLNLYEVTGEDEHYNVQKQMFSLRFSEAQSQKYYSEPIQPVHPEKIIDQEISYPLEGTLTKITCATCSGTGNVRCSSCSGSGNNRCTTCNGSGSRRTSSYNYQNKPTETVTQMCYSCSGSGSNRCSSCGGSGRRKCRT